MRTFTLEVEDMLGQIGGDLADPALEIVVLDTLRKRSE